MKLSDKILSLRKRAGLSQEELAEQLNVSRQAVSRWEVGSAQPDASNVLQLSLLFHVTADYLLNDNYESDRDIPLIRDTEASAKSKIKRNIALCISACGLFGNFIIYLLSRFIEVMVPHVTYKNGQKWYHWSTDLTGHSYQFFIQEYDLELLAGLFWILLIGGLFYVGLTSRRGKKIIAKWTTARKSRKESISSQEKQP